MARVDLLLGAGLCALATAGEARAERPTRALVAQLCPAGEDLAGRCERRVGVPVDVPRTDILDPAAFELELWLRRDRPGAGRAAPLDLLLEERAPMHGGVEPVPIRQAQLEEEILRFVADVTGEARIRRRGGRMPEISRIRALRDLWEIERAHERASYTEVEELEGESPIQPRRFLFLGAGVTLFGASFGLMKAGDDDDLARVRPKIWPPGMRLRVSFDLP